MIYVFQENKNLQSVITTYDGESLNKNSLPDLPLGVSYSCLVVLESTTLVSIGGMTLPDYVYLRNAYALQLEGDRNGYT